MGLDIWKLRHFRIILALSMSVGVCGQAVSPAPRPRSAVLFEQNQGQCPADVAFLARAGPARIVLTYNGSLRAANANESVRFDLTGSRPSHPIGRNQAAARSNYLLGTDPTRWRTGIPNFQAVCYPHAYPRIDLVWHTRGGEIEDDFLVAPGGDPRRIVFTAPGGHPVITAGGDLRLGDVRMLRPRAYQDGKEIACRYVLHGRRIGIRPGPYDRSEPLTIDPVLSFSTFLGGDQSDEAASVALDREGNIYVAGVTASSNFPVSPNAYQSALLGGENCGLISPSPCPDIFVSKFSNDGSTLLYSTFLGGSGHNGLAGMALDAAGDVYLAGTPGGPDFPKLTPLAGATLLPLGHFAAKLSADGSSLVYATMIPPYAPQDALTALAVDASGSVYLTGSSSGGLPVVNAFQSAISKPLLFKTNDSATTWQGLGSGFFAGQVNVITVDPSNSQTVYLGMWQGLYKSTDGGADWTTLLEGTPPQAPHPGADLDPLSIAVDPSNSQIVYLETGINGIYKSTDGGATWSPAGIGANRIAGMIAIDPSNTQILYAATGLGLYKSTDGAATWSPTALVAPASPTNPYSVQNVVIDPSTPTTIYAGTPNGVMKSLNGGVTWTAMTNGFTVSTDITHLAIDPVNPEVLYAATTGDIPPYHTADGGAHWTQSQWPSIFVSGYSIGPYVMSFLIDPLVHTTVWAATDIGLLVSRDSGATWSAPPADLAYYDVESMAAGSDGSIYAIANNDSPDAFALKLDPTGSKIVYSTYLGGTGPDWGQSVAVDSLGRAYITGFTSSFDFPVANALQARNAGLKDVFVSVLDPTGSHLLWSTYLGGSNDDRPSAIAIDPADNVHLGGWTSSSDFPLWRPSQSVFPGNKAGLNSAGFVTELKSGGSGLLLSTYIGGSAGDGVQSVATDPAGDTYVAGVTYSKDFPTLNAIEPALAGVTNAFVAAWNGQTGALQYSTYLGGSGQDSAAAIAADAIGNAYIVGSTTSSDFPVKYPLQYTYGGVGDAFLAKIAQQTSGPRITLGGIISAAGAESVVSPGELISIFGKALALTPASAGSPPLPLRLSDVIVAIDGVPAPLLYVSPLQINAQVPFGTPPGTATVQVTSTAGTASSPLHVALTAPAIFTLNSAISGPGAVEHGITGQLVTDTNPASRSEIVSVYCTGLGAVSPAVATGAPAPVPPSRTVSRVSAYIGGTPAQVSYAGVAPGFAGLYQVNVQVPATTPPGAQNLQISIGGASSNTVTISIH
jgi:uncharacterized protein (TIGR03437 family)